MADVEAGAALNAQIQSAVQPKLMENGWVVEENDTTLCEYVTMMVINGKDLQGVISELGGDLLGVGEDDAAVGEFARWLFEYAGSLAQPQQGQEQQQAGHEQDQATQQAASTQDEPMQDTTASSGDAPPTGPKSMRNAGSNSRGGRGGRMLGQLNRNMDRSAASSELPENLRKIRGAAGIQSGRINSHPDRPPRGPRGGSNMANGIQRAMGGGRGGHHQNGGMNGGVMNGQMNPQQQMQLMQMMEMQANILAQVMQTNGGGGGNPMMGNNTRGGGFQPRGRGRGNAQSRGGGHHTAPAPAPKVLHAKDGKMPLGALGNGTSKPAAAAHKPTPDGMDMDLDDMGSGRPQPKFNTMCRFNQTCTNPSCDFAHQNPTSTMPVNVDLSQTCSFGADCKNFKCTARHPSPAAAAAQGGMGGGGVAQVDCKFWPHCTNASCPFRHGSGQAPCRNGPDCSVEGCTFAHSKIACRFHPCTNSRCTFKHEPGQKAGATGGNKVWSKFGEGGKEELILPGKTEENGGGEFGKVKEEKMDEGMQEDVVA